MPSVTSSSTHSRRRFRVTSAFSFIAALLIAHIEVSALTAPTLQHLNNASVPAWGIGAKTSIGEIVGSIILTILGLLGVIFVILLTYGGFLWLTAAGEDDKVKKAQGLMWNAIIGLLIVIAAYSIAWFVLNTLVAAV